MGLIYIILSVTYGICGLLLTLVSCWMLYLKEYAAIIGLFIGFLMLADSFKFIKMSFK